MSPTAAVAPPAATSPLAGLYLRFRLGREYYAVPIDQVREIIEPPEITPVPMAAAHVRGVINLRGRVLSVVDLSARLGMDPVTFSSVTTIIILLGPSGGSFGVIVDEVLEVLRVAGDDAEAPPELVKADAVASLLLGMARSTNKLTFLLDLRSVGPRGT